jgi:hypothetical protein
MTTGDADTDWGALYVANVEAVAALAGSLDDEQVATTLPATPAWTVHDVYAHLAGGPADSVSGRTDGAPGPEWTARHVSERQGLTLADLVEELRSHADHVVATLDPRAPGQLWDIATHHADLHEGLGLGRLASRFWAPIVPPFAERRLRDLPADVACGTRSYGAGGPAVDVAPYELFRAFFSRRSRGQLRAWGAPVLSDAQLDAIPVFGPRDDDQPVPVG